jgi:hypothetical protein
VVREPHAVAILACDNPEAIVLDFMQPQVAGGQLVGLCGKARRDEAGGYPHILEHYALAKDMALQFGDVPIGLGKMFLFLSTIHGFAPTTRSPGRKSPGAFPFLCIGAIRAASVEGPTQALVEANG